MEKISEIKTLLLHCFQGNHLLSLLAKDQILARSAGRQFPQATRRCFEIVGGSEPNQAASAFPSKEVESGYRHVPASLGNLNSTSCRETKHPSCQLSNSLFCNGLEQ